jgi:hypothetical protein
MEAFDALPSQRTAMITLAVVPQKLTVVVSRS